jgi:hypothetical protein
MTMPQDESSKIPPPCDDCGGYHTKEERDAFERAQKALRLQIADITEKHGTFFDEMCARLRLATGDAFESTVLVACLAHWLVTTQDVPEQVFNRVFDTLLDAMEENSALAGLMKAIAGKKVADA